MSVPTCSHNVSAICWFRNDLRLRDNAALTEAAKHASENDGTVLCVWVCDPRQFGTTSFGFERTGVFRTQFLRESLEDLRMALQERGSDLLLTRGFPESVLPQLADLTGCTAVFCNDQAGTEERSVQRQLARNLKSESRRLHVSPPSVMTEISSLPFSTSELPELFTHFRKVVEAECRVPDPSPVPEIPPGRRPVFPEVTDPEFFDQPAAVPELQGIAPPDPSGSIQFVGGEQHGLQRLQTYIRDRDCLRNYKETRNGLMGEDYSSKFSPWLAAGCLSARQIHSEVRQYEMQRVRNDSTYWMIFELLWRDYFQLIALKHGADLFRVGGLRNTELPWSQDPEIFRTWAEGRTGYPLIDACMRELSASGFMSNRGRQNAASFLTKNLGIDWRMGAEWFESLLIDYDVASNYGNWNYTAGIGNDARGFRWFNTLRQAEQYDPNGDYVVCRIPELRRVPTAFRHTPWKMHSAEMKRAECIIGRDYPLPVVELRESAERHQAEYERVVHHRNSRSQTTSETPVGRETKQAGALRSRRKKGGSQRGSRKRVR